MEPRADFREVVTLAHDFGSLGGKLPQEIRQSVKRAGQNVKTDAQKRIGTPFRLRGVAPSINYEVHDTATSSSVVIGYDASGQGNMGHWFEYGTDKFAPRPALFPAFEAESQRFPEFMASIAEKVIREAL